MNAIFWRAARDGVEEHVHPASSFGRVAAGNWEDGHMRQVLAANQVSRKWGLT
jgi:hypothetical protein